VHISSITGDGDLVDPVLAGLLGRGLHLLAQRRGAPAGRPPGLHQDEPTLPPRRVPPQQQQRPEPGPGSRW